MRGIANVQKVHQSVAAMGEFRNKGTFIGNGGKTGRKDMADKGVL